MNHDHLKFEKWRQKPHFPPIFAVGSIIDAGKSI